MQILQQHLERIKELLPRCYYAESEFVTPGTVAVCKETDWNHQFYLLHPSDTDALFRETPWTNWVHLRDAPIKLGPIPKEIWKI